MVCRDPGDKQAPVCSNVLGLHGHAPTAASGVGGVEWKVETRRSCRADVLPAELIV